MHRTVLVVVVSTLLAGVGLATLPASAAAAPVLPSNGAAPNSVYVVKPGDFLIGIAAKLKVSLRDLLAVNRLTVTSLIWPGMRLTVPAGGVVPAANPSTNPSTTTSTSTARRAATPGGLTYAVRPGDYLSGIAARAGVRLSALLAANGLKVTSVVHPGRVLQLPAGARPIAAPAAPTTTTAPTTTVPTTSAATASRIDLILAYAQAQKGKPYRFNAAGPDAFDCSGLVRAAFLQAGISLPHQSLLQSRFGTAVDWTAEPIRPGDLVFTYSTANPTVISHVGIALSATTWIQAPQSNDVVRIGPLPARSKIVEVRRLIQP